MVLLAAAVDRLGAAAEEQGRGGGGGRGEGRDRGRAARERDRGDKGRHDVNVGWIRRRLRRRCAEVAMGRCVEGCGGVRSVGSGRSGQLKTQKIWLQPNDWITQFSGALAESRSGQKRNTLTHDTEKKLVQIKKKVPIF